MVIDNNPLTVFNRQLEKDELDKPIGSTAIAGVAKAIGAVSQIPTLRPLGLIAKGFDRRKVFEPWGPDCRRELEAFR